MLARSFRGAVLHPEDKERAIYHIMFMYELECGEPYPYRFRHKTVVSRWNRMQRMARECNKGMRICAWEPY